MDTWPDLHFHLPDHFNDLWNRGLPPHRPANCHSFRVRLKQLPHPQSDFRLRKSEKIAPISNSFIYVIIDWTIFFQTLPHSFSNLTQLPHLRLAGLPPQHIHLHRSRIKWNSSVSSWSKQCWNGWILSVVYDTFAASIYSPTYHTLFF